MKCGLCILAGLAVLARAADLTPAVPERFANGVVAVVGDAVITWRDVEAYTSASREQLQRQYWNKPDELLQRVAAAEREAADHLIERKLILHEFKTANYNFPESLIEDQIKRRIRDRFGDRLRLTRTLQAEGTTYETFRQRIREDIIIAAMRSKNISQEILISPHKIEKYYAQHRSEFKLGDQVRLRIITINRPSGSPPDTNKKLAEEIHAKLAEGASFSDMARIYSEDSFRAQGGDRGWVDPKTLRKELAEVALNLEPGQKSRPIDAQDAWCLLLVENSRRNYVQTLPEVRDEIEKNLQSDEVTRLSKAWVDRLRTKCFVRIFL